MEYLIEQMGQDGRWWIVGSERSSGWAQVWMRRYAAQFPSAAFRVLEYPSRRIVVLHDLLTDERRAMALGDAA